MLQGVIIVKRKIGKYHKKVSAMGMGCWAIGGPFKIPNGNYYGYGEIEDPISIKTIHQAIELGINFFETADVYGTGHSEKILGEGLKDYREDVVIATKFGSMFEEGTRSIPDEHSSDPSYVRNAVNDSLRRLQTDFIDLYQYHWWACPFDEAVEVRNTLEDLVNEGVIGGYGWSTDDVERAKLFSEGENCLSMEYVYNIGSTNPEMLDLCEKENLASIIRGPLGYGILTGKYTENYTLPPKHWLENMNLSEGNWLKKRKFIDEIKDTLVEDGRTMAQAALGYIWGVSETSIPIPGAKNPGQIIENAEAMEFGPLSHETIKHINQVYETFTVTD